MGVEAVLRSGGKNPQLKGVVHEILYRDALTMKPGNLANGARGTLSKSVTAVRDDVLLKQGGRGGRSGAAEGCGAYGGPRGKAGRAWQVRRNQADGDQGDGHGLREGRP